MKNSVERLRKILVEELKNYPGDPIVLTFDNDTLEKLIFNDEGYFKRFAPDIIEILMKIDYSNIDFSKFNAQEFDFSPYTGIKIDPQTIYNQSLENSICKGVEFIGSFCDVNVIGTDFTGSKGAEINPQKIFRKDLSRTICRDVKFIGLYNISIFNGVKITNTDFIGSNYEAAIKEENEFREKIKTLIYATNKESK